MENHIGSKPRKIEFFGMPGSGKTTLQTAVSEGLMKEGSEISTFSSSRTSKRDYLRRFLKAKEVFLFSLLHPRLIMHGIRFLRSRCKISVGGILAFLPSWLLIKKCYLSENSAILDQGILQFIWSVRYSRGRELNNEEYFGVLGKPDLVIILEAEVSTIVLRLKARSKQQSRLERELDNTEVVDAAVHEFRKICDNLAASSLGIETLFLENNNENDLVSNIDTIVRSVVSLEKRIPEVIR